MRPLPETVKNKIFELWMNGQDYRSISSQVNASLGSITNVINETRRTLLDIDELRNLNLTLKRNSVTISDAIEGTKFVLVLKNLGVDVSSLGEIIGYIAKYGNDAPKILLKAGELLKLEAEHGMEYSRIVEEYQKISKNLIKLQNDINTLRQEYSNLQNEIINLNELKRLQEKLYELKIPIKRLDQIISQSQRLEELGFTPETAEILSSELVKHGINMETAIKTLIRILSEYKSLTESIEIKRKELENIQSELVKS
ncbi:MAG: coiled-coil domain-containing protein, partial [Thermoprotei archaeon]